MHSFNLCVCAVLRMRLCLQKHMTDIALYKMPSVLWNWYKGAPFNWNIKLADILGFKLFKILNGNCADWSCENTSGTVLALARKFVTWNRITVIRIILTFFLFLWRNYVYSICHLARTLWLSLNCNIYIITLLSLSLSSSTLSSLQPPVPFYIYNIFVCTGI